MQIEKQRGYPLGGATDVDWRVTLIIVAEDFDVCLWFMSHKNGYIALILDLRRLTLRIRLALAFVTKQSSFVLLSTYLTDEPTHFDDYPFLFFVGPKPAHIVNFYVHLLITLAYASFRSCLDGSYLANRQVPYDRLATRDAIPTGAIAG